MILEKQVIIIRIEGASDKTVSIKRICILDETSCGLVAGSTSNPNLNGNNGSA